MQQQRRQFVERENGLYLAADWVSPVFLHYRVKPGRLREYVPFELDLFDGLAWVTLVAFTLQRFRPSVGGVLGRILFHPFREQRFLNVRTYVKHGERRGIQFLAEWISDWCNSKLGPLIYSLPYRYGRLEYHEERRSLRGLVGDHTGEFVYRGCATRDSGRCAAGSRDAFLLERYHAFNSGGRTKRWFRVWHEPWLQSAAEIEVKSDALLCRAFPWWRDAEYFGAHHSPGAFGVLMGRPRRV